MRPLALVFSVGVGVLLVLGDQWWWLRAILGDDLTEELSRKLEPRRGRED